MRSFLRRVRKSRASRWTVRAVGVLGVLVAVLLIVQVTVLPGLVHRLLADKLAEFGLPEASFEVRSVGWWSTELANLALDPEERLRVGSVGACYSLSSLLRGSLETVEVTGAEVELRVRGGVLDLGPLADITPPASEGELPFGRIEVRSSSAILDLEGRPVRLPLRASIVNVGEGRCTVEAVVECAGTPIRLSGNIDTNTKQTVLTLDAAVRDLGGLLVAARPGAVALPGHAAGSLDLSGELAYVDGRFGAAVKAKGRAISFATEAAGHRVSARGLSLDLTAELGSSGLSTLRATLRADHLALDGAPAQDAALAIEHQDGQLKFAASAKGPFWQLAELKGAVRGLLGPPQAPGDKPAPITAEASWKLQAGLPRRLADAWRARGTDLSGLGRASVTGRATARLGPGPAAEAWDVELAEVQLSLGPGTVRHASGAVLAGVAAKASLSARASPRGVSLQVQPGAKLSVAEATLPLGAAAATVKGDKDPPLVVALGQRADVLVAPTSSGKWALKKASVPELRLGLTGGRATMPSLGITLDGIEAHVAPGLAIKPSKSDKVSLKIAKGARASVRSLVVHEGAPFTWEPREPAAPILAAEICGDQPEGRVSLKNGLSWRVSIPQMRLRLGKGDVAAAGGGVKAAGLGGELLLGARLKDEETVFRVADGSWLGAESLTASAGGRSLRVGPVRLALGERGEGPALRLVPAGLKQGWAVALEAASADKATVALGEAASASLASVQAELTTACNWAGTRLAASLHLEGLDAALALPVGERTLDARILGGTLQLGVEGAHDSDTLAGLPLRATAVLTLDGAEPPLQLCLSDKDKGQSLRLRVAKALARATAHLNAGELALKASLAVSGISSALDQEQPGQAIRAAWRGGKLDAALDAKGRLARLGGMPLHASFDLTTGEGDARVALGPSGTIEATKASACVRGSLAVDARGRLETEATVAARIGSVGHDRAGVRAAGISVRMPFAIGRKPAERGKFTIAAIHYGTDRLPPLEGSIGLAGTRADFDATWRLLDGPDAAKPQDGAAVLKADGTVDFAGGSPRGRARIYAPKPFVLGETNQPGTLLAAARPFRVAGTFALNGTLFFSRGRVTPMFALTAKDAEVVAGRWKATAKGLRLDGTVAIARRDAAPGARRFTAAPSFTVTVEDGTAASKDWEATVEGIDATVKFTGLGPLTTPGQQFQVLLVRRVKLGDMEAKDGMVAFRLERAPEDGVPPIVRIRRTAWGWAGGRLSCNDVTIDPREREHKFTVALDDLKLGQLTALVPDEYFAGGAGTLDGRLPMTVAWPKLTADKGYLRARPGRGRLLFGDTLVDYTIGHALPDIKGKGLVSKAIAAAIRKARLKIISGLKDYEYSTLEIDFNMVDEGLVATLRTSGTARVQENPVRFGSLVYNFRGFEHALGEYIMKRRKF